jgi:hypothetical protein
VKNMRICLFGTLSLAVAAGLSAAASAQFAPGLSGKSTTYYAGREESLRDLTFFGRCYAQKNRDESLSLLATKPSSVEEAKVYTKLFRHDNLMCLAPGTTMRAPLAYVRGAIAEGLVLAEGRAPASHALPAPSAAEVRNLSDAARCYAAGHKEQVQALLATRVGSQEENDAVSALMGDLAACLPPGVEVKFDATVIRYRLVEALLRLQPGGASATGQ